MTRHSENLARFPRIASADAGPRAADGAGKRDRSRRRRLYLAGGAGLACLAAGIGVLFVTLGHNAVPPPAPARQSAVQPAAPNPPLPATTDIDRVMRMVDDVNSRLQSDESAWDGRFERLETAVGGDSAKTATLSRDLEKLTARLATVERQVKVLKAAPHRKIVAHHAPASGRPSYLLQAVANDHAWLSARNRGGGSTPVAEYAVGQTLPGWGKILAIGAGRGGWEVRTERGTIAAGPR